MAALRAPLRSSANEEQLGRVPPSGSSGVHMPTHANRTVLFRGFARPAAEGRPTAEGCPSEENGRSSLSLVPSRPWGTQLRK